MASQIYFVLGATVIIQEKMMYQDFFPIVEFSFWMWMFILVPFLLNDKDIWSSRSIFWIASDLTRNFFEGFLCITSKNRIRQEQKKLKKQIYGD